MNDCWQNRRKHRMAFFCLCSRQCGFSSSRKKKGELLNIEFMFRGVECRVDDLLKIEDHIVSQCGLSLYLGAAIGEKRETKRVGGGHHSSQRRSVRVDFFVTIAKGALLDNC